MGLRERPKITCQGCAALLNSPVKGLGTDLDLRTTTSQKCAAVRIVSNKEEEGVGGSMVGMIVTNSTLTLKTRSLFLTWRSVLEACVKAQDHASPGFIVIKNKKGCSLTSPSLSLSLSLRPGGPE